MRTSSPCATRELRIAGMPAAGYLRHDPRLSHQLLGHVAGGVAPRGATMPCGASRREAAEVIRGCLELVAVALQGGPAAEVPERLRARIGDWASEGVDLEAVQHATHLGFRFVLELLGTRATGADSRALVVAGQRLAEVLDRLVTAFTGSYLRELRAQGTARDDAGGRMASALIAGEAGSAQLRGSGFPIADAYAVLAFGVATETPDDRAVRDEREERRRLRRMRLELAAGPGGPPPALLAAGGGTVLLAQDLPTEAPAAELLDGIQRAAGVPLLGTVVHARTGEVPAATRDAHQLLDLAQRLHRPAGLYRMADLAVEYQITRPGPGRRRLAAVLDPLRAQPELLNTLVVHLRNDRNRQRTSRTLHIHANTIDHRMRRIAQHTGLDPMNLDGLWYLRAALVANTYETGAGPVPIPELPAATG
ncbi:PucR family transcriptional regulator [Nocardia asteroides]|uniref:PucR family transcriptional regulator n=1 Tax=Nocardia asteroides TaxID=1824 RepID=UPI001E5BF05A|nr:helix-turn-helix domain-containing protein [Nocardia asteroides]UGT63630.1 helix-turn-helix domain-containing protein [Nocardia asteroides]